MSTLKKLKQDRIDIRITPEHKTELEQAAEFVGISVSAFILEHALFAARNTIMDAKRIELNDQEWSKFAASIVNPPEPNLALSALMKTKS